MVLSSCSSKFTHLFQINDSEILNHILLNYLDICVVSEFFVILKNFASSFLPPPQPLILGSHAVWKSGEEEEKGRGGEPLSK